MGVPNSNSNNTPTRNRKVGLPDPQGNDGKANVATTGPSKMVQNMAAQNFALRNGGQLPPSNAGVSTNPTVRHPDGTLTNPPSPMGVSTENQVIGRFEAQRPVIRSGNGTTADGAGTFVQGSVPVATQKQWPMGNDNQGGQPVVRHPDGSVANTQVQSPYTADMANKTAQPQTNFENMQQQPTGWNPDGTASYGSLSEALNNASGQPQQNPKVNFQADPNQRDGGFFGWLKGLMPKKRPGRREGETDDEYDARRTRNMQMVATFADAIRHMGNIVNTSKGAPLQVFNDPTTMLEQGRQTRMAARQKKEAADADAAYKQANMTLKERAAEADRNDKAMSLWFKQQAAERQAAKDKLDADHWDKNYERLLDNDKFNQGLAKDKFDENKRHNKVSEGQGAARITLAQERNSIAKVRLAHTIATGGGSGKGGSLTNLSSPTGHLNRKKDLNAIEKKQITQYMIKNGYINKKNLDAWNNYINMGDAKNANDLQNYWIAYAANMEGKKGDTFRKMLKDHYMYGETSTVEQPKASTKKVDPRSKISINK